MDEYEIDYKKQWEELQARFMAHLKVEKEYFELQEQVNELRQYADVVTENIIHLKMIDQVKVLRKILELNEVCKSLCEKYNWNVDEEICDER